MRFEVYKDKGGQARWRLLEDIVEVSASGESFASESNAKRAAEEFKVGAKGSEYRTWETSGKWYWDANAANGDKVATSAGSFESEAEAERVAHEVRDHAGQATGP